MTEPLLRVEALKKYFPVTRGLLGRTVEHVRAVDGVSFDIAPGETVGLVGESGCGKSTVGRTLLHLYRPTAGRVWFEGRDIADLSRKDLLQVRRDMQIVFQDPFSSLNPRMRVFDIVGEALLVHGLARREQLRERVLALLDKVGVSPRWADRYAHEFSGGQRQRIGIARAIAMNPKLVVCDEAVSALDVSIQAQIINLLIKLREELGLSYLFISHDLSVVRHISHRVMVMYLGQVVELAATNELFEQPANPYTRALLSAVPVPDPRRRVQRIVLQGDVPTPLNPPSGCRFHTRCPVVFERCPREEPPLYRLGKGSRTSKCFHGEGLAGDDEWYPKLLARFERAAIDNGTAPATELRSSPALPSTDPNNTPPQPLQSEPSAASSPAVPATDARRTPAQANASPARAKRRGRLALVLALGLTLTALMVWMAGKERRHVAKAQAELTSLRAELSSYADVTGQYPKRLSALGYRLAFIFGTRAPSDPWGRPYHYAEGPEGSDYQLFSLGPDGVPSEDDVR